jgi:hypothetical protein
LVNSEFSVGDRHTQINEQEGTQLAVQNISYPLLNLSRLPQHNHLTFQVVDFQAQYFFKAQQQKLDVLQGAPRHTESTLGYCPHIGDARALPGLGGEPHPLCGLPR